MISVEPFSKAYPKLSPEEDLQSSMERLRLSGERDLCSDGQMLRASVQGQRGSRSL